MSSIGKYYESLPSWSRGVVTVTGFVAGLTALGFASYFVYKAIQKAKEDKEVRGDVKDLDQQGSKQTYLTGNYKTFADKIETAGTGQLVSTDKAAILDVFKNMKTDMDITLLVKAFGKRYAGVTNWNATLGSFLLTQIGKEGVDEVNNILKLKSIKYKF